MINAVLTFLCPTCAQKLRLRNYQPGDEIPNCPNCGAEVAAPTDKFDFKSRKAPSRGGSSLARAVDIAETVAREQYGLTDLKDNLRAGDTAAPRLTPTQAKMAEAWTGGGIAPGGMMGMGAQSLIAAAKAHGGGEAPISKLQRQLKAAGRSPTSLRDMTNVMGKY